MYLLMTDETNIKASDTVKFFAYGGIFFRFELIPELDSAIKLIRIKYGFGIHDELKFNTKVRPEGMDQLTYTQAKNDVLQLCIDKDCRFIAYVVHHKIAEGQDPAERLTYASDHVLKAFHDFLVESKDTGIVLMDTLPITKSDSFLRNKFRIGLSYPSKGITVPLERIHLYGTTGIGMSNISSLIDICLGSFRYCINNPQRQSVAQVLFKKVLKIMWHQDLGGGKLTVHERGLILRPSEVKSSSYKTEYGDLIANLRIYASVES